MKRFSKKPLAFFMLILIQSFLLRSEAQEVIDVRDYGVTPWSFENASPAIVKAIETSQTLQAWNTAPALIGSFSSVTR